MSNKSTAKKTDSVNPRTQSYTRFKAPPRRAEDLAPSTLPPPPFDNEVDVPGHEAWFESHMDVASSLLCLEQLVDHVPEESAEKIRGFMRDLEAVRDALYEMYCDAADERLKPLAAQGAPLDVFVTKLYAACKSVLECLVLLATSLKRGEAPPDDVIRSLAAASNLFVFPGASELLRMVKELEIDVTSPVEPLRNLHKDLDEMFSSATWLHHNLKKQFG
jgi:hypothetical protein